ncbi:MAG: aldehyde dehydrogenase [Gammaproteobacteria bacterium]|jgi:thiamine pyrophosphate-dependent acetolactate synthase large subunit-like protein|nr:aldehyde dehydrogenase [Gammaproteobacteria bacterium]
MDSERSKHYPLYRREVVARLLRDRGDMLVVAGLGASAWDITAAGDDPLNFPLWGAMGGAVPMGLGLALSQPGRRVLVVTGDGEMLMGLGSLATVALQSPANLGIVVLDNEHYGETGMQSTHTAGNTDLAAMAIAAGFPVCDTVRDDAGLEATLPLVRNGKGPVFLNIKIRAETPPLVLPPKQGVVLKNRFRLALLGAEE